MWADYCGSEYIVTGRDKAAAKALVPVDVATVRDRMAKYLRDARWRDRSLWHFVNVINQYVEKKPTFRPRETNEGDWT